MSFCSFYQDDEIGGELKLKRLQKDKPTEPEQSVKLKPFDDQKSQDRSTLKPESKSKEEPQSAPSKDKKEKQELAKEGHMKKNEDMDRDKEDSKPISQPTVDGSDDVDGRNKINKRNDSEVERKSGNTLLFC